MSRLRRSPLVSKLIRTCRHCEIQFETYHETANYCSRSHKEQAREKRRRARQIINENRYCKVFTDYCDFCGGAFVGRRANQRFCSKSCQGARKEAQARKRERELNVKASGFRQKIYFRDNGLCQLCQEPVLLTVQHPDPKSLSIDHIVPLSKGGVHAFYNLQLAHLSCNVKKSNKINEWTFDPNDV